MSSNRRRWPYNSDSEISQVLNFSLATLALALVGSYPGSSSPSLLHLHFLFLLTADEGFTNHLLFAHTNTHMGREEEI